MRPNAADGLPSATSAPPIAGPASDASCVQPEASALPACRSSPGSSEGMTENEAGRNIPSPAPSTTATGTSSAARAGPAAMTASADMATARTASVASITVCGRQRSLAQPPAMISAVRGMP